MAPTSTEPVAQPAPMVVPPPPTTSLPPPTEMPPPPPLPVITDHDIRDVYVDVLAREPSRDEVREWRYRSEQVPLSLDSIADALRATREYHTLSPELVIRRAYWDFHHVEPPDEDLRFYRRKFIDERWSAGRVRRSIAEREIRPPSQPPLQPETPRRDRDVREDRGRDRGQDTFRGDEHRREIEGGRSPEAIVRRAYDDLLERKPDPAGLEAYVRLLREGASEEDIRRRMKQSEEYRVTLPDSKTRRAYREILGRDADESGLQHYRKLIVDKGWTEDDVKNDLRKSAEYRNRKR